MSRNKRGKKQPSGKRKSLGSVPTPPRRTHSPKPSKVEPKAKAGVRATPPGGLTHWADHPMGRWLLLVAILVGTFLVYWGTGGLNGGWLLDDYGNIVNNAGLAMHHFSWAGLWSAMWSFHAGPLGRPLSLAFFALQRLFGGLDPTAFKAVNLIMHLGAVILLYGFTRALLHAWRRRLAPGISETRVEWVALAIAAAWALHPMNLTPILYAVQRETIFAALFTLAGLWLYVVIRERFRVTTWPVLLLLAIEVAGFTALGAYAKETGVLLPLFILVLEALVFRFRDSGETGNRMTPWLYVAALFFPITKGLYQALTAYYPVLGPHSHVATLGLIIIALLILFAVFHYCEHGQATTRHKLLFLFFVILLIPAVIGLCHTLPSTISGSGFVTREFNLSERVLTEGRIVLMYIFLTVIPWLPGMALHHDYFTLSTGLLSPASTLGAFLILAALLLLAWLLRRRRPLVALGILWFFASQILESTVFALELAYEHRIYLGDWGLILAVAALALLTLKPQTLPRPFVALRERLGRPLPTRAILSVLAVAVVVLLGSLTAVRAWHWQSNLMLARYESTHHPDSPRATYLLARIETNLALGGQTQYMQPAFEDARKAAHVYNSGLDPWVAMILLAAQTGRPVPTAWFDGMIKAVAERPFTVSDVNALQALISCYTKRQCNLQRHDLVRLFKAIHASPRFDRLGMNYANVLVTEANFIGYTSRAKRARSGPLLLKAANAQKGVAQFQINVFNVALQDGQLKLAEKMLARTEKLNTLSHLDRQVEGMQRRLKRAKADRHNKLLLSPSSAPTPGTGNR